jgi:flagellar FliL protein
VFVDAPGIEEMVEVATAEVPAVPKRTKLLVVLGMVFAAVGGGGGFYAVQSGMILGSTGHPDAEAPGDVPPMGDIAFVPIDPLVVNLGDRSANRHLRFSAQLEVPGAHFSEVKTLSPRIVDVLNSYLRAVDLAEIEDRTALVRLRAQMLRRVQLVAGAGRVRDLLIVEFVVN